MGSQEEWGRQTFAQAIRKRRKGTSLRTSPEKGKKGGGTHRTEEKPLLGREGRESRGNWTLPTCQ